MSNKSTDKIHGRGAQFNPANRFDKFQKDEGFIHEDNTTKFIPTFPKALVNKVESPDIPFMFSMNPYQGCEHGCVYCYARNTHPYWGYSAGLEFEQNILIKKDAPKLLRQYFNKRGYQPNPIMLSGNTDCYQPAEQKFKLTRQLLEICLEYRHPVSLITKNALITRDIDILSKLAIENLTCVVISITTLDEKLRLQLEPRTSTASKRMSAVKELADHNIPVSVMMAPVIPGLTLQEIFPLVKKSLEHKAYDVYYSMLRLNGDVEPIFKDWLQKTYPDKYEKIIHQTEEIHGGSVSDHRFQKRMKGEGTFAENIHLQFKMAKKKYGMPRMRMPVLDCSKFQVPGSQLSLVFDL